MEVVLGVEEEMEEEEEEMEEEEEEMEEDAADAEEDAAADAADAGGRRLPSCSSPFRLSVLFTHPNGRTTSRID